MKTRIVVVHWLDAIGDRNDVLDDDAVVKEKLRAVNCVSVGVLIERTRGRKGYLKMAAELIEGGEYQELQVIPNGMVLSVKSLPLDLPKDMGKWSLRKAT